jgi:O-antigen/teichoic acid export membrane protein
LIGFAVSLPVRIWLVRHLFGRRFSPALLRRLLAFGLPLVPASLSWWVITTSDLIVLGKLSTLSEAGLYAVALGLASVLALFVTALGLAWSPHALQAYEERREDAPAFFGRMATFIVVGCGVVAVLVTTFADEALMILSTPTFYGAALAVGPLALGFVASASMQVTSAGISLLKKTYWFLVFSTAAAALNLGLNILLVPHWGMLASAWAACVSYVFLTVGYGLVGQRLWAVEYQYRRLLTAALVTFGFVVGVRLLPDLALAASVAMKAGYALAYVALLVVLRVVGREELAGLGALVRRRPSPRPA